MLMDVIWVINSLCSDRSIGSKPIKANIVWQYSLCTFVAHPSQVERFDLTANTWQRLEPLHTPRTKEMGGRMTCEWGCKRERMVVSVVSVVSRQTSTMDHELSAVAMNPQWDWYHLSSLGWLQP
jgi:hypothetical protein